MTKREETYEVDTSRPYKLNAGTSGVCEYPHIFSLTSFLNLNAQRPCPLPTWTPYGTWTPSGSRALFICRNRPYRTHLWCYSPWQVRHDADQRWLGIDQRAEVWERMWELSLAILNIEAQPFLDLVWESISSKLGAISGVWWEMADSVRSNMHAFKRVRRAIAFRINAYIVHDSLYSLLWSRNTDLSPPRMTAMMTVNFVHLPLVKQHQLRMRSKVFFFWLSSSLTNTEWLLNSALASITSLNIMITPRSFLTSNKVPMSLAFVKVHIQNCS